MGEQRVRDAMSSSVGISDEQKTEALEQRLRLAREKKRQAEKEKALQAEKDQEEKASQAAKETQERKKKADSSSQVRKVAKVLAWARAPARAWCVKKVVSPQRKSRSRSSSEKKQK